MRFVPIAFALFPIGIALAQPAQVPDPADLKRFCGVIENQRNSILTSLAGIEATAQKLAEENAKLKAEIESLKKAAEQK